MEEDGGKKGAIPRRHFSLAHPQRTLGHHGEGYGKANEGSEVSPSISSRRKFEVDHGLFSYSGPADSPLPAVLIDKIQQGTSVVF